MSLNEFIKTEYALKTEKERTDLWQRTDLSPYLTSLTVAEQPALAIQQSEATLPLIGPCQQVIYINYKEQVIVAKLCPKEGATAGLDYKADLAGRKLYFQIISTLQFNNNFKSEE